MHRFDLDAAQAVSLLVQLSKEQHNSLEAVARRSAAAGGGSATLDVSRTGCLRPVLARVVLTDSRACECCRSSVGVRMLEKFCLVPSVPSTKLTASSTMARSASSVPDWLCSSVAEAPRQAGPRGGGTESPPAAAS